MSTLLRFRNNSTGNKLVIISIPDGYELVSTVPVTVTDENIPQCLAYNPDFGSDFGGCSVKDSFISGSRNPHHLVNAKGIGTKRFQVREVSRN